MKEHNFYWMFFAPMMKRSIQKRFGKKMAVTSIRQGKAEYRRLVAGAPEIGKGNPMAENAYFAYAFVGAWLGSNKQLTPDDMALVMTDVLTRVKFFFGMTDLNRTPKKWYRDMKKYEAWYDAGNGAKYPTTWKVHFDENLHRDGSYYYFSVCPICSYLTGLGLGEIMRPLCETDKVMFAYQHGVLHREHTIASGGSMCDYWTVGDRMTDPR
ncbi:MAG: L-2-amino-thiazoline-4-carboxylic acid hydrolase [Lachnospiraceae bacterium]|nr:L-2-amino-thiazoline-4-carboxylic acid hydrolase [Lachnospiraceae bacterium]